MTTLKFILRILFRKNRYGFLCFDRKSPPNIGDTIIINDKIIFTAKKYNG